MTDGEAVLSFQCDGCSLVFSVETASFDRSTSDSEADFCCPLCRENRLLLAVGHGGDDA